MKRREFLQAGAVVLAGANAAPAAPAQPPEADGLGRVLITCAEARLAQPIGDRLTRGVLRSPRNILDVLRGQYRQRVISAENPRQPRAVNSSEPAALTRALSLPEKDTTMDSPQWQGAIALRASRIVTLLTELIVAENLRDLRLRETRLTSERGTPAHRATFQAILDQKPEPIVADWALIHMGKLR